MRISDWSSDVCSSDLAHAVNAAAAVGGTVIGPACHRRIIAHKAPRGRQEAAIGVFGVDAVLDRPAIDADVVLRHRRSEERRVGKGCVSTCRSRWSPYHYKKT